MNALSRHRRIVMWVVIGIAVGFIAYGSWLGLNMSAG